MKWIIWIIIQCSCTLTLSGQMINGEIVYEVKEDMHRHLSPENEMYKNQIPQYKTSKYKLVFQQEGTLYTTIEEEKDNTADRRMHSRGKRFGPKRRMEAKSKIYYDISEGLLTEEIDFLGKQFLIKGEGNKYTWKITGEQKQVGDFLCQKAIYQDSTQMVGLWFTPMIPVPSGPAKYVQLPGMVLHVDINEGEKTYTAIAIESRTLDEDEVRRPEEGEEISRSDFEAIKEEKMSEMRKRGQRRRGRGR